MRPRWRAVIHYRSDKGPVDVRHDIEELDELHNLVELGPDWNSIERIEITLARTTGRCTIEEAENG